MTSLTNDDSAKRELSTGELETVAAGMTIQFPFHPREPIPVKTLPWGFTHPHLPIRH
jgi:hypothetical protein